MNFQYIFVGIYINVYCIFKYIQKFKIKKKIIIIQLKLKGHTKNSQTFTMFEEKKVINNFMYFLYICYAFFFFFLTNLDDF